VLLIVEALIVLLIVRALVVSPIVQALIELLNSSSTYSITQ